MALVLIIRNVQDLTETIPESGILLEKAPTSSGPFLDHCAANFFSPILTKFCVVIVKSMAIKTMKKKFLAAQRSKNGPNASRGHDPQN